ncbi:hypothetical protein BLOT_009839 [Blomia tropicalis]|nr:hypothetical protein BLOT_009839 [Blomia tropicalis]
MVIVILKHKSQMFGSSKFEELVGVNYFNCYFEAKCNALYPFLFLLFIIVVNRLLSSTKYFNNSSTTCSWPLNAAICNELYPINTLLYYQNNLTIFPQPYHVHSEQQNEKSLRIRLHIPILILVENKQEKN